MWGVQRGPGGLAIAWALLSTACLVEARPDEPVCPPSQVLVVEAGVKRCVTPGEDAGPADSGRADADAEVPADMGAPEVGAPDGGRPDLGPPDAGPGAAVWDDERTGQRWDEGRFGP